VPTGLPYFGYQVSDQGALRSFGSDPQDYSTDVLADQAIRFIQDTPAGRPLFLYLAPHAPHIPAVPAPQDAHAFPNFQPLRPPSYDEADVSDKPAWVRATPPLSADRKRELDDFQRDMLRSLLPVDRAVGRILDELSKTHRLENTLFVFTSDNGWLGGEHRLTGKNAPYEESIRVPMVVRYDASLAGPTTDSQLVTNIDLAPTFAELAGASAPGVEGRSLVPLFQSPSAPWRSDFLIEHLQDGKKDTPTFCEVRSSRYAYVLYETGEQELYDLPADPYELENRAEDPGLAPTVTAMRARVGELCHPPPPGFTLP
jgi:N-acetylglucosamine-6-sulfatase